MKTWTGVSIRPHCLQSDISCQALVHKIEALSRTGTSAPTAHSPRVGVYPGTSINLQQYAPSWAAPEPKQSRENILDDFIFIYFFQNYKFTVESLFLPWEASQETGYRILRWASSPSYSTMCHFRDASGMWTPFLRRGRHRTGGFQQKSGHGRETDYCGSVSLDVVYQETIPKKPGWKLRHKPSVVIPAMSNKSPWTSPCFRRPVVGSSSSVGLNLSVNTG